MPIKIVNGKEYLTVSAAAQELGLSPATIRRYCEQGDSPPLEMKQNPVSKYRYITRESVDEFKRKWWGDAVELPGKSPVKRRKKR